ncbi:TM2 domain-containing protein [Halobacteriovorax sp. HLS]|uniref:NINE protein n=1 Tax=Halobacteriovorax sp. HLS TaxID=2234000 RepID=UPI000FD9DD6E|nr:TM2 domain-containing protein [Halobacteriovorax sp. HLS]
MSNLTVKTNNRIIDTHSLTIGYLTWIFGFTGSHRFYYGKPISGTIWFFTLGLLGVGWLIDLFLIPSMDAEADTKYWDGEIDYTIAWILLVFLGAFGVHKFYMRKVVWGVVYFLTAGFFFMGILYDYWTLNEQIDRQNTKFKTQSL